jgi:hypothetical protein
MLTLHPQSAMEHLHRRFVDADGSGSDGAIAFEATEVSSTSRARTLVPVRPAEPLAGAPDRSPIPLADNVQAAGIAVGAAAGSARTFAGGTIVRTLARVQDLLPQRRPVYRRVTPLASRRETQRRAALALLALVVVVGGLGLAVYAFGGNTPPQAISSVNAGQKAFDQAKADLAKVTGPGIDLVTDDPEQAVRLLTDAYRQLDTAAAADVSPSVIAPLRKQTEAGLDRYYGVVPVTTTNLFTFKPADGAAPIDLGAMVRGPDDNPYVIDRSSKTVYRIGLKTKAATVVVKAGQKSKGLTVATPRYLAVGGEDLLILDSKNVLWRWRPADDAGKGTLTTMTLFGAASLGDDITGMDTFLRPGTRGLYNLYIVDPSEQQIRSYSPAADGSGFPAKATPWLATARDVSTMTSTYVDGDLFAADGGSLVRFVGGKSEGWDAKAPKDTLLRPAPKYSIVAAGTARREGPVYAFDRPNGRIVAVTKVDGKYVAQYRLADGASGWSEMRSMYVIAGVDPAPSTLVWMSSDGVNQAALLPIGGAGPSASPGRSPSQNASPGASPSGAVPTTSKQP